MFLGTTQLADIVNKLPEYQENIYGKIVAMRNPAGSALSKAVDSIKQLSADVINVQVKAQGSLSPNAKRSRQGTNVTSVSGQ